MRPKDRYRSSWFLLLLTTRLLILLFVSLQVSATHNKNIGYGRVCSRSAASEERKWNRRLHHRNCAFISNQWSSQYELPPVTGFTPPRRGEALCVAAASNKKKKNNKQQRSSNTTAGGGFGGGGGLRSSNKKNKNSVVPQISPMAKQLLKKHGNNVDAASSDYFASQMKRLHNNGDEYDLHAAKVKATWDTVGLFLPCDYARTKGKVEPYVDRRLKHILTACCGGMLSDNDSAPISILDVGCGDGAMIPYLFNENSKNEDTTSNAAASMSTIEYKGLDVSSVMIDMAKVKHPKQTFVHGSFPEDLNDDELFDTILFNGSLQFFRDTLQTLRDARARLATRSVDDDNDSDNNNSKQQNRKSRIVLSHVEGGRFVKDECRTSHGVAVRNMPNKVSLEDYAKLLKMRVLYKEELLLSDENGNYDPTVDGDDDQFYLVALETL